MNLSKEYNKIKSARGMLSFLSRNPEKVEKQKKQERI